MELFNDDWGSLAEDIVMSLLLPFFWIVILLFLPIRIIIMFIKDFKTIKNWVLNSMLTLSRVIMYNLSIFLSYIWRNIKKHW